MAMATNGNRLTDMEFDEISLVTRPANQLSKVVLFKSDTEQESMTNKHEVEKAKGGKMPEELKRKFMSDEMEKEEDMEEDEEEMDKEYDEDEDEMAMKMKKGDVIDLPSEVYEYIEALEAANSEMSDQLEKMATEIEKSAASAKVEKQDILKSADPAIVEIVKAAEERAEAAERIAKAERDHRLEREFVAKAASLSALPAEAEAFGKVLKSVADAVDTETFDALLSVLSAANEGITTGNLFAELGKSSSFDNDGPTSEINKAAARLIESNPGLTREQAVAKAVEANPSLYNEYLRGN